MAGYIKLYRDIQTHWLWEDKPFSKGQAWIDLLLTANHEEAQTIIGNEIITIERGCLITSEVKLAERWGWSRTKVRDFLSMLIREQMIDKKSDNKKTWIKVLNYDIWQNSETAKKQQIEQQKDSEKTAEKHQKNTNNNNKNNNNINRDIYIVLFEHWNSQNIVVHKKLTDKMKTKLKAALNNYTEDDIKKAISNYSTVLHDDRYYWTYRWTLEEFLQRGIERFLTDACFENYLKKTEQRDKPSKTTGNIFLEDDV